MKLIGKPTKSKRAGKIVTAWILPRHFKMWREIENKSEFIQICMDNAIDIMAWALMREYNPKKYTVQHDDPDAIVKEYNNEHPTNPLTQKRIDKNGNHTSSGN